MFFNFLCCRCRPCNSNNWNRPCSCGCHQQENNCGNVDYCHENKNQNNRRCDKCSHEWNNCYNYNNYGCEQGSSGNMGARPCYGTTPEPMYFSYNEGYNNCPGVTFNTPTI